jgi:DNA-binding transcriptional ArsR family regulator
MASTWLALSDPHRRAAIDLLRRRPRTVNELVEELGLSQPGTSKHLRVLREAGLVRVRPQAQRRVYEIDPGPLAELDAWLALQEWFPTTVEFDRLEQGAPIAFRFADDAYPPMSGEVLELQPPHRFSFTWGDDRLTFELEPGDGGACRLTFTVALDSADKAARDAAGWDQCLDMLGVVVDGRTPQRPAPSDDWRVYYEEYRRLGLPATAPIPE